MSSTPSNALRGSSANGAARRMTRSRSSTPQSSIAVMATTCCATMSSGFRGKRSGSTEPAIMPSVIEALGQASRVHEDERRAMRPDELKDLWVDRGPDRRALDRRHGAGWYFGGFAQACHVLDRYFHTELERFLAPSVQHAHRAQDAVVETAEEARDLVERTLRRGEADALELWRVPPAKLLETLEAECEVRTALGRDDRM